jgi:hypothetical protein
MVAHERNRGFFRSGDEDGEGHNDSGRIDD